MAKVDGVSITTSRVEKLARLTKRPPAEVVDELVSFELLAREARRRGLARHRDVRYAVRQAMVHRFLEREFEDTHRLEDMPEAMLRRSYQKNIDRFVHPRLRKVTHILVLARDDQVTKARQREAGRLAQKIYREAASAKSVEEFHKIGRSYDGKQGFEIKIEVIGQPVFKRSRLIVNFINAAMKLQDIGDVSPPVETIYGTHVIYLMDVKEAKNVSFEEAKFVVREKEHPNWIKISFAAMVEELRHSTVVKGYEGEKRRVETL